MDSKKIPNLVICDAQYLPFKNDVFEIVVSRQVIEHIKKPLVMLNEMARTSKGLVVVETTHRRGERTLKRDWKHDAHVNKFDFTYFAKAAKKVNCTLIKSMTLNSLPLIGLMGFNLITVPYVIRLIIQKNDCKDRVINSNKVWYHAEIERSLLVSSF